MRRSSERILTTHAGSLPRPKPLVELYARRAHGQPIDEGALDAAIREATRWVVPKQREAGIDVGNNGEQPREGFFLYVQRRMSGFGGRGERAPLRDVANYPSFAALRAQQYAGRAAVSNFAPPKLIGPLEYRNRAALDQECDDFRAALDEFGGPFLEPFLTAPSPGIIAAAMQNEHYDSFERYVEVLADALSVEYEAIVARGFLLQLDCPDLALERHISYADRPLSAFIGFVELIVAAINRALVNVPREQVRLHVCWGNYEGPHDLDVPLEAILPAIARAEVGGFVFPLANPRHAHEHRCFRGDALADDQVLVAGVIDTTTNYVEHPEVVAERIERVARALGDPHRVLAGTDCGFDTSAGMGRVAEEVAWAKLRSLSEGARIATERLM